VGEVESTGPGVPLQGLRNVSASRRRLRLPVTLMGLPRPSKSSRVE
jgi:hypothetical protein